MRLSLWAAQGYRSENTHLNGNKADLDKLGHAGVAPLSLEEYGCTSEQLLPQITVTRLNRKCEA